MNRKTKSVALPSSSAASEVRRRIIAGARRHFFASGFRHVTMDDLAAELGMSKKTLYAHFPGKNDLLKSVLMDKFDDVEADLARISTAASGDVRAALRQLLARVQHHTDEIQPHFIRDLRRAAPEMFQLVEARRREIIPRHFGKLFAEARQAGLLRDDIPAGFMIEILLGAVEAIINPPKMAELGLTPKTAFDDILKVILYGVVVRKGKSHL
jgi:AcrR family transcriptional regulator